MPKIVLLFGFLVAVSAIALAQDNDPKILLYDDGVKPPGITTGITTIQPNCTNGGISGTDPETGDPTCQYYFVNNTGSIIDGFTFETTLDFTPPETESYSCQDFYFNMSCTATLNGDVLSYVFSETTPGGGIPTTGPHSTFYFLLDGWSGNFADVTLQNSYSVPEASSGLILLTELLLLAGLARFLGLRWYRSSRITVQSE